MNGISAYVGTYKGKRSYRLFQLRRRLLKKQREVRLCRRLAHRMRRKLEIIKFMRKSQIGIFSNRKILQSMKPLTTTTVITSIALSQFKTHLPAALITNLVSSIVALITSMITLGLLKKEKTTTKGLLASSILGIIANLVTAISSVTALMIDQASKNWLRKRNLVDTSFITALEQEIQTMTPDELMATYKELTKAFDGKLDMKKEISTQTGRASERRNTISSLTTQEPRAPSPIRLIPPVYASPSAETSTVSVSQVPIIQQPVASTPVSTTTNTDTMELSTSDIKDLFTPITTNTTTTQSNITPITSLKLEPKTTFPTLDLKDLVLGTPIVHPDKLVETQGQYKESSVNLIIDGSDPAKLMLQEGEGYKEISVYKKPSKSKPTDVSGFNNMCLANCLQNFSKNKNANDMYELPDYSPTPAGRLEKVVDPFKKGEMQSIAMIQSFCAHHKANCIVYDNDGAVLATVRTTEAKACIQLLLHNKHFQFFPSSLRYDYDPKPHNFRTYSTGNIRGGADIPAIIRGISAVALTTGIGTAMLSGVTTTKISQAVALWNSGVAFTGSAKDFGVYMCKEVLGMQLDNEDNIVDIYRNLINYGTLLLTTRPTDLNHDPRLVDKMKSYGSLVASAMAARVNTDTAKGLSMTLRTLVMQVNSHMESLVNAATTLQTRPIPKAYMLRGKQGVGKTSLVQPLCKDISEVLEQRGIKLPPTVYDLRQDNNGYFGVYSGQPYGLVDEFQLKGDKDPFFDCINRLISNTSFAMPSAYVKDQFCKINCIFLCSNSELVNLKGRFPGTSIPAIKSRIQDIEVRFCPDGVETEIHAGNRDTIVRQEDHSDLVFIYHTYDAEGEPITRNLSYTELVMLCADGITHSIEKCQLPPPNSSLKELEQVGKMIEERMASFKIEDIGIKMQQSQSGGTEHVICHIFGDPGTGKTTLVENKILPRIAACLPHLPVYNFKSKAAMKTFINNPANTPIIALLDDMIINHPLETQDLISSCQNPSIIIHTSNQKVKEKCGAIAKRFANYARRRGVKSFYTDEEFQLVKNYHKTWITEYMTEGLARRSGMYGTLIANGKKVLVGRDFSSCYQMSPKTTSDVSEPMIIGTKIRVEPSVITKTIFQQYCDATTRDDGLVIKPLRGITIPSQLDVEIKVDSIEKLRYCCEKPFRFTLLKGNEKCDLTDKVIRRYNGFVPSSTKPTGSEDPTLSLIRNFIVNLWRGGTDLQCKLEVGAFTYYAHQGVLYVPETLIANITCKDDNVTIGDTILPMKEVHRYLTQKKMLKDYTEEDKNMHYFLATYREEIEALPEYRAYCARHDTSVSINASKVKSLIRAKKLYGSIPKVVRVVISILIAASILSVFGASIYGLIKLCSSKKKAKVDKDKSEEGKGQQEKGIDEDEDDDDDIAQKEHPYVLDLGIKREEKKGKNRGKGSGKGITSEHNPTGTTTTVSYGLSKFELQSDTMGENVRFAQGTHMLFLDPHTAVTVGHSSICTGDIIFNQPVTVFGEVPNHDIKYLDFRKAIQGVKNIHNKLAKLPDLMNAYKGTYKGQDVYMRFAKTVTSTLDGTENTRKVLLNQILASRPDHKQFTFDGECGTPLIIRDPSGKRVIAGILTGSTGGTSLFSWIPTQVFKRQSQERYHALLMEGQKRAVMPEEYNILKVMKNTNNMDLNILGGVEPIGRFEFYPPPVKDTKKRTPYADKVGELAKCPAVMTHRSEPGPYHSSKMTVRGKEVYAQLPTLINKHAMVMKDLDPKILEIAVKMSIIHKIKVHGTATKKMTPYQVLNGFRGKDNSMWSGSLGCIRLDTGAGIWQSIMKVPLKNGILGKDSNGSISWLDDPIAARTHERCNTVLAKYRAGEVPFVIYLDSLKSELLPIDKVAEGKIRLYQAAPIEQVYAGRTLFGIFMALSNLYHLKLHSQVGINPYTDIDPIIRRFLKISDTGEDGDYKNYDKSIPYELILAVGSVVNGVLDDGEENATGRLTYLRGMARSVHAANGVLYSTPQGNPSGDPLTTMLNNEVNVLIEYYCFVKAFERLDMSPKEWEEFFHEKVDFVCAGDDKITVIHPSIHKNYNFQIKQDIITHDLGMQYTPASKETTGKPIIELMSMSFCSRRIRYDSEYDIYVGALKVESLLSLLQWVVRKSYDQMAQNINVYISEAVFHDDDIARELFLKLDMVYRALPELRSLASFPLSLNLTRRLIYHSLNTIRYSTEGLDETTLRANDFPCNYIENDNIIIPQNFDYKCYSHTHTDISGESFILYTLVPNTPIPINMEGDWVSKLCQLCQKNGWKLPEFTQKMLNEDPIVWQVHGTCEGKEGYGYESSVKKAKNAACHTLYNQLYWKVELENISGEMAALMGETVVVTFKDGEVIEEGVAETYADINQLLKAKVKRKALDIGTKRLQSIMPGNMPAAKVQDNRDPEGTSELVIAGKVPAMGIIAGGVTGDLKRKAYENWFEVKHGHIDATTSRFDILATIKYEKNVLGGFQKRYTGTHAAITGDIAVKLNIMGQPGQKGSFIICVIRTAELGPNTTALTPNQVTSIFSKEFSARDNTEFDFKLEFFSQTQAYIDNTKPWPTPEYTWCLLTGFKTEGLLATSDSVSTISYAFRTRLAANFIAENAFMPPHTLLDGVEAEAGPSQFVGKKLNELFEEDVFIVTDGFRANTMVRGSYSKNKCGKMFPFDPTEEVAKIRLPTSAVWDEDKLTVSYDRFDGMRCDANNVFSNTWPTAYNPSNKKYAQLFGEQPLITRDMFVEADIGYKSSTHYYLSADALYKSLDKEYGGPSSTGTIGELRIKTNIVIGEPTKYTITVKNCTYRTWGKTTMIEFDYANQTQLDGFLCSAVSNYGNLTPDFEYSRANLPMVFPTSKCAGAFMGYDFEALNVIEDSNKGSYYYPTIGMTRVTFTPITPPQVSAQLAKTGNPSVTQGIKVEEKLQEIRKTIPEGKELEFRIKEDYMGQFAIFVRIPADPEINPYTYSDLKYAVADFRPKGFTIVQAQVLNKGAPISKRAATLFRDRIVSDTLEQLPEGVKMIDIGQKHEQAAAAIIAGGAIAGLGSALGSVGGANLNNKYWKEHNSTMFNQYEKILTQKFGQQFELAEFNFDRNLSNATAIIQKQMEANVEYQRQIRNMNSPAYNGAIPTGNIAESKPSSADASISANIADDGTVPPPRKSDTIITPTTSKDNDTVITPENTTTPSTMSTDTDSSPQGNMVDRGINTVYSQGTQDYVNKLYKMGAARQTLQGADKNLGLGATPAAPTINLGPMQRSSLA